MQYFQQFIYSHEQYYFFCHSVFIYIFKVNNYSFIIVFLYSFNCMHEINEPMIKILLIVLDVEYVLRLNFQPLLSCTTIIMTYMYSYCCGIADLLSEKQLITFTIIVHITLATTIRKQHKYKCGLCLNWKIEHEKLKCKVAEEQIDMQMLNSICKPELLYLLYQQRMRLRK